MSSDPNDVAAQAQAQAGAGGDPHGQPSEEELRAAYEAEMSRITSADMILQATVSLLHIGGYRLGLSAPPAAAADGGEGEAQQASQGRDLEQVRDAIDAARALLPILERRRPGELRPLRDALSQLQMAYAREAGATAPTGAGPSAGTPAQSGPTTPAQTQKPPRTERKPGDPGPAESSGRLWVPGR